VFGRTIALAVAAAAFGALAIPTSPARAQEWFGVQIGPFGFGFGTPYYGSYYYPYDAPYYPYYYPYGYRWGYPY
jgi:hypothetical protein